MSDHGPQPPEQEKEERRTVQRELVKAYKRFAATDDGRLILADLELRTHANDDPYAVGIPHGDLAYRCGTQSPIRYMRKMIATVLKPMGEKREKKSAKSGTARTP